MLKRLLFVSVALLSIVLTFVAGELRGSWIERVNRFQEEEKVIQNILATNHLNSITVHMYTCDGLAFLHGHTSSKQEFDKLRTLITTAFGEVREHERMYGVSIMQSNIREE